jgi:hypothetical protein
VHASNLCSYSLRCHATRYWNELLQLRCFADNQLSSLLISYNEPKTKAHRSLSSSQALSSTSRSVAAPLTTDGVPEGGAREEACEPEDAPPAEDQLIVVVAPEEAPDESQTIIQIAEDAHQVPPEPEGPEIQEEAAEPAHEEPADKPPSVLGTGDPPRLRISTQTLSGGEQAAVYLVKKAPGKISSRTLEEQLEFGVFTEADSLHTVSKLFEQVYIPILLAGVPEQDQLSKTSTLAAAGAQHSVDGDLLAALQKFLTQMKTSSMHLTGNVQLNLPDFDVESMEDKDEELLQALEAVLHDWTLALQNVKQAEAAKTAANNGPLDEIYFWSERNNVLGSLNEQINLPKAQSIIQCAACALDSMFLAMSRGLRDIC